LINVILYQRESAPWFNVPNLSAEAARRWRPTMEVASSPAIFDAVALNPPSVKPKQHLREHLGDFSMHANRLKDFPILHGFIICSVNSQMRLPRAASVLHGRRHHQLTLALMGFAVQN